MTVERCRCGHARRWHFFQDDGLNGPCTTDRCMNVCLAFNPDKVLPGAGERLTFGVHRQAYQDAESAPSWAPCGHVDPVFGCARCMRRAGVGA